MGKMRTNEKSEWACLPAGPLERHVREGILRGQEKGSVAGPSRRNLQRRAKFGVASAR
jgi:hypothetical protein